jgi:hypothetical protein
MKREKTTFDKIATGLDDIPIKTWHGREYWTKAKKWISVTNLNLPWIEAPRDIERIWSECKTVGTSNSSPEHVKMLAINCAVLIRSIEQLIGSGDTVTDSRIATFALNAGVILERIRLAENETPAASGKKSHLASKLKGRKPPAGSLRDYFDQSVPNWKKTNKSKLLLLALKRFPARTQKNLWSQIHRMKKG